MRSFSPCPIRSIDGSLWIRGRASREPCRPAANPFSTRPSRPIALGAPLAWESNSRDCPFRRRPRRTPRDALSSRVFSGSGQVSYHLPQRPGLTEANFRSTHSIETNFPLGRTVHLEFGRHGRTVVGSLRAPPDLKMRPEWRRATLELRCENPSGDGQTRDFKGPAETDGSFAIDNVPPGGWALSHRLRQLQPGESVETLPPVSLLGLESGRRIVVRAA
jgi:hypothetical protein